MKTSFLDSAMPATGGLLSGLSKLCSSHQDSAPSAPSAVSFVPLKFKYVIFRAQGEEIASIVPAFAQHSDIINLDAKLPISAGFAWLDADRKVHVEGESVSLKLKSRPEDAEIIRETLLMNGL